MLKENIKTPRVVPTIVADVPFEAAEHHDEKNSSVLAEARKKLKKPRETPVVPVLVVDEQQEKAKENATIPMRMHKVVALVASSGGGSATLSSGEQIAQTLRLHLEHIVERADSSSNAASSQLRSVRLCHCILVLTKDKGMDFIDEGKDQASLWLLSTSGNIGGGREDLKCVEKNTSLLAVNEAARCADEKLAALILSGDVDALVCISCDPKGVNKASITAAVDKQIPIVGTGGTSISDIAVQGGNVIGGSGGSVAATSSTRGICFASSLARYFNQKYELSRQPKLPRVASIIGGALPFLVACAVLNALLSRTATTTRSLHANSLYSSFESSWLQSYSNSLEDSQSISELALVLQNACWDVVSMWQNHVIFALSHRVIPVLIASITCAETSQLDEVGYLAGAAAGALVFDGSLVGGVIAGIVAGFLLPRALVFCARYSLLPTATSIISLGFAGLVSGALASFLVVPYALAYAYIKAELGNLFAFAPLEIRVAFGAALGYLVSWCSENGYYHAILLPLIALEMEHASFSFLGAFDVVCLCMPCAGVCFAVYMKQIRQQQGGREAEKNIRLGWKGFISNLFFSDFVEACYPFTLHSPLLLACVRLGSSIGGAILLYSSSGIVRSSAYLPHFLSCFAASPQLLPGEEDQFQLHHHVQLFLLASLVAFATPALAAFYIVDANSVTKEQ